MTQRRKTTFNGRRPLMEDDLRWKMTFDGRRPLKENNLWQVMAFDRWQTLTEDDIWWKTTSVRVFSILPEKNFTTPHLDSHSTTDPNFCLYFWSSKIPDKSDSPWHSFLATRLLHAEFWRRATTGLVPARGKKLCFGKFHVTRQFEYCQCWNSQGMLKFK